MAITLYSGVQPFSEHLKTLIRDIRPHWLLEELGVPYKRVAVDFSKREHKTPDFLKINPFGKIPALQDEGISLFESAAICIYLADKFGKFLAPSHGTAKQTEERAQCVQWIFAMTTTLEPHLARVLAAEKLFPEDVFYKQAAENSSKILAPMIQVYEERYSKNEFIVGDSFSIADIITTCAFLYLKGSPILADSPQIQKMIHRNCQRAACQRVLKINGSMD